MRHIIAELAARLSPSERAKPEVEQLASYGCLTQMHVVRLLAPQREGEDQFKDIDFSPSGIGMRREAGYQATMRALEQAPWQGVFDPIEGVILHEQMPDLAMAAEPTAMRRNHAPS